MFERAATIITLAHCVYEEETALFGWVYAPLLSRVDTVLTRR